jgi:hypothetical protein
VVDPPGATTATGCVAELEPVPADPLEPVPAELLGAVPADAPSDDPAVLGAVDPSAWPGEPAPPGFAELPPLAAVTSCPAVVVAAWGARAVCATTAAVAGMALRRWRLETVVPAESRVAGA